MTQSLWQNHGQPHTMRKDLLKRQWFMSGENRLVFIRSDYLYSSFKNTCASCLLVFLPEYVSYYKTKHIFGVHLFVFTLKVSNSFFFLQLNNCTAESFACMQRWRDLCYLHSQAVFSWHYHTQGTFLICLPQAQHLFDSGEIYKFIIKLFV